MLRAKNCNTKASRREYSQDEIECVVSYIDKLNGSTDRRIDEHELEWAFRRSRRMAAAQQAEKKGRQAMNKLEQLLSHAELCWQDWFHTVDKSSSGFSNDKVTLPNLRRCLKALCKKTSRAKDVDVHFNEIELDSLMMFMDPNADGSLDFMEVQDAFRRLELDPEAMRSERTAGRIMKRLGDDLRKRNLRIGDLFRMIDTDESGYITSDELRDFLNNFDAASTHNFIQDSRSPKDKDMPREHDQFPTGKSTEHHNGTADVKAGSLAEEFPLGNIGDSCESDAKKRNGGDKEDDSGGYGADDGFDAESDSRTAGSYESEFEPESPSRGAAKAE